MLHNNENIFIILDTLLAEYKGWTIEYVLSIPLDIVMKLYKTIANRKKEEYTVLAHLIAAGSNAGFSGKIDILKKLFKQKVTIEEQENQMRNLWIHLNPGKDIKEFEEQRKKGAVEF